ncbi:MAG: TetR/AcrR family transcriptional regulator [Hyphomicrobiales bacterium]|nr:TetR/AcrR family transcriptional regulator [Hyphomicrobiales bacterium]
MAIALEEFRRDGYDGVGVARLGAAIGVNPPSLYAAFGSKFGLFERAVELYARTSGEFIARALQSHEPVGGVLAQMFADAAREYTRHHDGGGCLVMNGSINCTNAAAADLTREYRKQTRTAIEGLIAREAPAAAPDLAGYVVFVLAGLSAAARDGASVGELLSFVDRAMNGIRTALAA